ncbi:MAG: DHHA1 domain-containing protein [bacterium]|nr:DHHA1 domain-containing protein [bacterium]
MKQIVILYHNDCTDGFSSAWAAWKKFGNKADYVGIDPGSKPTTRLKGKEIYMLDLIYPIQYLGKLIKENKKVIAIDHHISNQKAFNFISNGLFDLKHSGAVLSWKYFHPKTEVPKFLKYVEDVDLWKFKLPKTKEIISYLNLVEFSFKNWDKICKDIENRKKYSEYIKDGHLILKYEDIIINKIIDNKAELVKFFGYKTYAVNSPLFNSQIGNILSSKFPPIGIVWSQDNDGGVHVSLRSNGAVDVSKLAARFKGGGGHKKSAGFYVESCSKLPWKKLKK